MNETKMKLVCVGASAALVVQKTYELETLIASKDGKTVLAGNLEKGILVTNNKAALLETIKKNAESMPSAKLFYDLLQEQGDAAIKEVDGLVSDARLV